MLRKGEVNQQAGSRFEAQRVLFRMVYSAAVVLFFWGIWSIPLLSHNEARRLVVVREMLAGHQWLTPTKNGVLYFAKPPLFYWVGALISLLSGSSAEWVLRLPSALAALFTTAFLHKRIRAYFGAQPALFSALVLSSSYFYVLSARRAEINVFFGMLCFTALLLYYDFLQQGRKKYLYLSFLVLGLAFLAKGPVALVFFLPPLLVYGLLRRDLQVLKGLTSPLGWLLFVLLGVSWFAYALYGVPDSPLHAVIHKDITGKVYKHAASDPFYSYFVLLLGAFAPWVPVLLYKPKRWLRGLASAERMFLLCAFGVPLAVMSCFAIKHGKYMLPIFPFVAAFLGCAVSDAYDELGQRWGARFHVRFNRLAGGLLVILIVVLVLSPPYLLKYRFVNLKPFAEKLRSVQKTSPVFCFHKEQIQLIYYYGEPIPVLDKAQLDQKLGAGRSFLLVAEDSDLAALEDKGLCLLEEFAPYLKKDRKGLLYGTRDFCRNFAGRR